MALFVTAELGRTGNLLHFIFTDTAAGAGNPLAVTAVISPPVVLRNGTPVVLGIPVFGSTTSSIDKIGLVTYFLPAPALSNETWTYSAPAGWAIADGFSAPTASGAAVINSVGQLEPLFVVTSAQKTMPLGVGLNWPVQGSNWGPYHVQANLMKTFNPTNVVNVVTQTADNHPLTVKGPISWQPWVDSGNNYVDSKTLPIYTGDWYLQADESNPAAPFVLSATVKAGSGSVVVSIVNPGPIGKQWKITVTRATPANWAMALTFTLTPPTAGTVPWTLSNELLIRPGDTLTGVGSNIHTAPSQNVLRNLTASNGRTVSILRHGDNIKSWDGVSSMVSAADTVQRNSFTWTGRTPVVATISQIRPWTPGIIYFWDSYGGILSASAPGSPGPYSKVFTDDSAFTNFTNTLGLFEVVFSAPHGFKTGSLPVASSAMFSTVLFQNATQGSALVAGSLNSNAQPIYVTGPNSILSTVYMGSNTSVARCTAAVFLTGTYTLHLPDSGAQTVESAIAPAVALGCDTWFQLPIFGDQSLWTDWLTRARDSTTPGHQFLLELGNEVWSSSSQGGNALNIMSTSLGYPGNQYNWYALQMLNAYNLAVSIFGARSSEIKLVCGTQFVNSGVLSNQLKACNTFNVPLAYFAVGPYPDVDASASWRTVEAWPVADQLDIMRHALWFNRNYRGTNSYFAKELATANTIFNVTYGGGPWPKPQMICYEAAVQSMISSATNDQLRFNLTHDAVAHPYAYDLHTTFLRIIELGGCVLCNMSAYCQNTNNGINPWAWVQWEGQQPGYGDGRSGSTVNQFATSQGGSPGDLASHVGPDTVNAGGNVSVFLQAVLDWIAGAGVVTASFTGPSVATNGVPSGVFTVRPSASWTGTITPSDSGAGGTFTPTSLSWSATSNAQTFTYTPAGTGTLSISASGSPTISVIGSPISLVVGALAMATLAGPATATQGIASALFFATPSTSWTGTITPSDGGAGGTFTPASLSWVAALNTQTFTYTAATVGTITVTGTASPVITVIGSPLFVVVSAPTPTPTPTPSPTPPPPPDAAVRWFPGLRRL